MTPIIIDIEASGFGAGSYPIEVGISLANGRTHCYLLRPQPDWTHWEAGAEAVHGLSRSLLESHGRPVREVAAQLNAILLGQTVYSDGWSYDVSWLARLFDAAGLPQTFRIDTLRSVMREVQLPIWDETRERVTRELALQRHRASSDALILQRTFVATDRKTRDNGLSQAV